jgi:septum formation protein
MQKCLDHLSGNELILHRLLRNNQRKNGILFLIWVQITVQASLTRVCYNHFLRSHNLTLNSKFVLASNSPRRKQLIALGGWKFNIFPAAIDETPRPDEKPLDFVLRMAQRKAQAVAELSLQESLILAADTIVVDHNQQGQPEILGKPVDDAHARQMLRQLRGHIHQVYTAIVIFNRQDENFFCDVCCTDVPMREYTDQEIDAYIATGDPLDKAGAYAIQHEGFHPVKHLEGCYANVVGLPLCMLTYNLAKTGITTKSDVAGNCQAELNYQCPVFELYLQGKMNWGLC